MPRFSSDEQKHFRTTLSGKHFSSLFVGVIVLGNVAYAQSISEELLISAVQRLHWAGLYVPEIKIIIGKDSVATVSCTVSSDLVKSEIVETLQMTDGVRDVVNRLVVVR